MNNRFIQNSVVLLLLQLSCIALSKDQTIEVVNSSNTILTLEHGVPEYSKAFIALKKIDPLQYQLNRAILNDSPEEIRDAVNAGANIHQPKIGKAPLLIAVLLKRTNAVETLLNYGATCGSLSEFDSTLEEYAIKLGDFKSAFLLLNKACDMKNDRHLRHAQGRYARFLRESFVQRKPEAALYLLKQCPRFFGKNEWIINKSSGKREWILKDAISMGSIFLLLNQMSDKQEKIEMKIFLEIVQEVIDHGYDADSIWNDKDERGTIQYLLYRYPEIVELFIQNGANTNYKIELGNPGNAVRQFTYPIFQALNAGNKEVIEVLLDNGAYLDQTTNMYRGTPLAVAINCGHADIVELLIAHDAKL